VPLKYLWPRSFSAWLLLCWLCASAPAAVPTDTLLPTTTKSYISIPNLKTLMAEFDKTQFGMLLADPVMQPFTEDLKEQLRRKWRKANEPLGLIWEDVVDVPSGEVCMASLMPAPGVAVSVMIADVTDKQKEAFELMKKIDTNLRAKGATREIKKMHGRSVSIYTHKKKQESSLASLEAYKHVMDRCKTQADRLDPHMRWFIEPFGFVEVSRIRKPGRKKKTGADMLKILKNQGFTAIQGLGGYVNFNDGAHEILHRTMVYAPAVKRAEGDTNHKRHGQIDETAASDEVLELLYHLVHLRPPLDCVPGLSQDRCTKVAVEAG
jgi:hypothetical protein